MPSPALQLCHRLAFLMLLLTSLTNARSQTLLTSSIRGTVTDDVSLAPLPGATIILEHSDPVKGTVTDSAGRFHLEGIPIGQHRIRVSHIGYISFTSDPLIVVSGKETRVSVGLRETVLTGKEVEIVAGYRKEEAINRMAATSIRSFSVDETFRLAGSYNDPARMVANFAGVTSGTDNRNDIIVRGNSPAGLQWRIDDLEIPNPNHFAAVGTTGGPVTLLNNNLVTNSDFLTGTFPAQYGNTVAGIFDLRLRNGNPASREYWFGIGWNGVEFGTEGPINRKTDASYILAYRYSILQLLSHLGVNPGIIPEYQDFTIKLHLPAGRAGTFTFLGIAGRSNIELFDSREDRTRWMFPDYGEDLSNGSYLGVAGLSHQIVIRGKTRLKSILYAVASETATRIDSFSFSNPTPAPWAGERSAEKKYSLASSLTSKVSPAGTLQGGITADLYRMSFSDSVRNHGKFVAATGSNESMFFLRGYLQWKQQFSSRFSSTIGVAGAWLSTGNAGSLEPRIGGEWRPSPRHTFSIGAGMYSQMLPRVLYFVRAPAGPGPALQPNKDLGFMRSIQASAGYRYHVGKGLLGRVDIYFQKLSHIPVSTRVPAWSVSNEGHSFFIDRKFADSLVPTGTGQNYGIELTLERFLEKNYFFLFTASLFNSTFRGADGKERNSAFNVNYALNAAGGYEVIMGRRKWGVLSFGLRGTLAGGNPYVPFDPQATVRAGQAEYDWTRAYEPRFPAYRRASLRFGIRRNLPGYNLEFFVDLQYRTGITNISPQRINPETGEIRDFFGMSFFPMGTWRIQF